MLGVDGGASKTDCCIATLEGTVKGWGKAGCANPNITSWADANTQVRLAVIQAMEHADVLPDQIISSYYGLGGIAQLPMVERWKEDLRFLSPNAMIQVENDVFLPIYGTTENCQGVAVVSGSGGNIGLIDGKGDRYHLNGKVHFASSQLGREALNIVMGEIQQKKISSFTKSIIAKANLGDPEQFVRQVRVESGQMNFRLTPLVTELAVAQDPEALRIVTQWLEQVKDNLSSFLAEYQVEDMPVCFGGSTFTSIRPIVLQELSAYFKELNGCWIEIDKNPPVISAIVAALRQVNLDS